MQHQGRQEILSHMLTTRDLCEMFGVKTQMTIFLWRRDKGLPYYAVQGDERDMILFHWPEVKEWAKANGYPILSIPDRLRQHHNVQSPSEVLSEYLVE